MHYQGNNVLKKEKVISTLLTECPEFAKSVDLSEGAYVILGDFAIFLRNGIERKALQPDELGRCFSFLNKMGESDDLEVHNLLVVGVLEILTDTDDSLAIAKQYLKGHSLKLLERTLSGWKK